jgi:ribosomal protein S18 acetylase RimI-like enzyme
MLQIEPLTPEWQAASVAYVRLMPYRNALLLSNVSQLRSRCDVRIARVDSRIVGIASTYLDLPVPNIIFTADNESTAKLLVQSLLDDHEALRTGPTMALLPETQYHQLASMVQVISTTIEYQMVVEPETLVQPNQHAVRRLSKDDIPAMNALAEAAQLTVWDPSALDLGPAFGCFVGDQLVAMAATHFATADAIEIGHVACHPDFRRRGYASACTAALTRAAFTLTPRVFLMVVAENTPALEAYKRLGFRVLERFWLTHFTAC